MIKQIFRALDEKNGLYSLTKNNTSWLSHQNFEISQDEQYLWVRTQDTERLLIFPKTSVSRKFLENTLRFYEDAEDDFGLSLNSFIFKGYLELNDIEEYNISNKYNIYDAFILAINIFRDFNIPNFSLQNIYKIKRTGRPVLFFVPEYEYYYDEWSKDSAAYVIEKLLIKRGNNE